MTYQELSRQLLIHHAAKPGGPGAPLHPPVVFPAYFHPFKDSSKPGRAESLSQPSVRAQRTRGLSQGPSLALHFRSMRRIHSLQTSTSQDCPPAQTLWPSPVYPLAPVGRAPSELQGTSFQISKAGTGGGKNASKTMANLAPTSTHSLDLCPRLSATPFGGPGKDLWVEQPTSHVVRDEDDGIALGVPIAEHSFVIVGPGET